MDVDSRKNESKNDLKNIDLQIEVSYVVKSIDAELSILIVIPSGSAEQSTCHDRRAQDTGRGIPVGEDASRSRWVVRFMPHSDSFKCVYTIAALGALSIIIIISMEIYVVKPKPPKAAVNGPSPEIMSPGGGPLPWVT